MEDHKEQISDNIFCNINTSKDSLLPIVPKVRRKISSKKLYICKNPECQRAFLFKSELNKHQQTHADSEFFVCPYAGCKKGFKRYDTLQAHYRLHTGEKPFKCQQLDCGMTFTTKAALRYHSLKHSNIKVYRCENLSCRKSFLTLAQLKQHEKVKCCTRSQVAEKSENTSGISKEFSEWLDSTRHE